MSMRKTMLATALAALAFAALPAAASAISVDYTGPGTFTVTNEGNITLGAGGTTLTCTGVTGEGQFANEHGGSLKLHFTGCKASGTTCTTSGSPSGSITTTTLPFDMVEVRHPDHETDAGPGLLITPGDPTNGTPHFASAKCAFGLVTIQLEGNGLIGTLTEPEPGVNAHTFKLVFEEEGDHHQTHKRADDTTGTVDTETDYDLKTTINGGEAVTSALVGTLLLHFTEGEARLIGTE